MAEHVEHLYGCAAGHLVTLNDDQQAGKEPCQFSDEKGGRCPHPMAYLDKTTHAEVYAAKTVSLDAAETTLKTRTDREKAAADPGVKVDTAGATKTR